MRLRVILLGLAAFCAALVAVFPAAWLRSFLPPAITCGTLSGSLWRGQCSMLAGRAELAALKLDRLGWKLHPLSLLRGRLQADISAEGASVEGASVAAQGGITLGMGGTIELSELSGTMTVDHGLLAALPRGWSTRAEARDLSLRIAAGRIERLGGVLLARQLRDARGSSFGDFRLEFPPQDSAPFRGALTDAAGAAPGPLQLQSQLTLNADQSWQLRGTVMLRPGAPDGLASVLDQLAPADLNGSRAFSLEGTAR